MASKPVEKTDKQSPLPRSPDLMNREDSALLVVDAQEKLLAIIPHRERIVWNIRRLLDAAAALGVPIAGTEQYPDKLSPTVPELKERIGPAPDKLAFSACVCGEIFERWREDSIFRVLVCGIETHVCVSQTAHDLLEQGIEVHVARDAVTSRTGANKEVGLQKMEQSGAIVTSVETALFELVGAAGTDEFKQVQGLVK